MLFWINPGSSAPQNSSVIRSPVLFITQTIQYGQTRYPGYSKRSRDELMNKVILWAPTNRYTNIGWPVKIYNHDFYMNTEYRFEDMPRAMNDRDRLWERVKWIWAISTTWSYIYIYIYIYIYTHTSIYSYSPGFQLSWRKIFPFLRPIAMPKLKNPICTNIFL